jgi:hypothetical protein
MVTGAARSFTAGLRAGGRAGGADVKASRHSGAQRHALRRVVVFHRPHHRGVNGLLREVSSHATTAAATSGTTSRHTRPPARARRHLIAVVVEEDHVSTRRRVAHDGGAIPRAVCLVQSLAGRADLQPRPRHHLNGRSVNEACARRPRCARAAQGARTVTVVSTSRPPLAVVDASLTERSVAAGGATAARVSSWRPACAPPHPAPAGRGWCRTACPR